jgi:hypothetical protein
MRFYIAVVRRPPRLVNAVVRDVLNTPTAVVTRAIA